MTIEAKFLDLMPSTVTIYGKSARDAYGKVSYSASGTGVRCRVQAGQRVIRGADGIDKVEDGRIYFYGQPAVSYEDKVTLPDGSQVTILSIEEVNDEAGGHHTVVGYGTTRA